MSETSKNAVNDKKKAKLEKKQMKAAKKDARKKESNVKVKTKKVLTVRPARCLSKCRPISTVQPMW